MSDPAAASDLSIRRHVPNALTASRVVLAVAFFVVLLRWRYDPAILAAGGVDWTLIAAAALFIVAALTDALDGHLARRWGVVSVFGRIMDPFADKLLVIGAFICLAGPGFTSQIMLVGFGERDGPHSFQASGVEPWMAIVVLARELLVTSIRAMLEGRGVPFPATTSGKLKMVLQSICVPAVLILLNFPPPNDGQSSDWAGHISQALVWATVLVTAWSGVPYVVSAARALRANPAGRPADTSTP